MTLSVDELDLIEAQKRIFAPYSGDASTRKDEAGLSLAPRFGHSPTKFQRHAYPVVSRQSANLVRLSA